MFVILIVKGFMFLNPLVYLLPQVERKPGRFVNIVNWEELGKHKGDSFENFHFSLKNYKKNTIAYV